MATKHRSICRCCTNSCAIVAHVEEGRVVKVTGDADDPLYAGYSCVKGRSQPALLNSPDRLLRSLKRTPEGHVPIPVTDAMDEIAEQLLALRARHGARSIAGFAGHMRASVDSAGVTYGALFALLGSSMKFTPNTIDKGGKQIAQAMHGRWLAPAQGFDSPRVGLLIGVNPLLTYTGFPAGNPRRWLRDALAGGMQLIVIDPRRSETAAKATMHLRPRPGHDPDILAAMVRVILEQELQDTAFVSDNVTGLENLRRAVAPFTPQLVGERAGLDSEEIIRAARVFATAGRGYAFAGTGPNMAGTGSLTEYLVLCLETICGHWLRANEPVAAPPTLLPLPTYKAQAEDPVPWSTSESMRVRSLKGTTAGLPTAALVDEILTPGEGQVHALLSWNGNPALSFPDQTKAQRALKSLDLLVQLDPFLSVTARMADYVIAPTMPLEAAATTSGRDGIGRRAIGYGYGAPYAHHSPAVVDPPPDSELIEEWRFFQGLYERIRPVLSASGEQVPPVPPGADAPDIDGVFRALTHGSRVPLDVVRAREGGHLYPDEGLVVAEKEPGWQGRLDVGNDQILADLADRATVDVPAMAADDDYPFRLLCRRMNHVYNSVPDLSGAEGGRRYNPAFMHPGDLANLGLAPGELAEIRSSSAAIIAVVEPDPSMLPGSVGMSFGFGGTSDTDHLVREIGSSPSRLIRDDQEFDRYTGQPRMSNVPIMVRGLQSNEPATCQPEDDQ